MAALIDHIPTWVLGVLIVGLSTGLSGLGLIIVHRFVPADARRTQNDIAGYISNIAAFVYAVLLAFIAVAVWQEYGQAQSTAQHEANAASDVYRQAQGYPEPFRQHVRDGIKTYVDLVIRDEWPRQTQGDMSYTAWRTLRMLHEDMLTFRSANLHEQLVHAEQLRDMRRLMDDRRTRLFAAASGLHPLVWTVILVGSVLIVVFTYFMGAGNFRAHLAMTMILGASIGLVIFLIVAMDYPFRGDVGIKPDAFVRIRENINLGTKE